MTAYEIDFFYNNCYLAGSEKSELEGNETGDKVTNKRPRIVSTIKII